MTVSTGVQCYRVGGSVRDELMGLPAGDRDWVVVGATPEQMIARGFQPVGKDFPVFLHPKTHEEYALARTERKTAPGYKGFAVHFAPDVSLEDDLLRRDITINAMAVPDDEALDATALPDAGAVTQPPTGAGSPSADAAHAPRATTAAATTPADGPPPATRPVAAPLHRPLIDPFNGLRDLHDRIFRHVSPAFREDPVRILRVARFAARFPDFRVADETLALMRAMSAAGEVDALVPERVWQEISRGLMSARPSRMMQVLDDSGALAILLPPLSPVAGRAAWLQALDDSAARHDPLPVRFSIMMAAAPDSSTTKDRGLAATARRSTDQRPGPAPGTQESPGPTTPAMPGHAATRVEQLARGLRAPNDCIDAAQRLAGEISGPLPAAARQWLQAPQRREPAGLLALLARHDAWRRPERLQHLLRAVQRLALDADTGAGPASIARIEAALAASQTVDTGQIARQHAADPKAIRTAIDAARLQAIEQAIGSAR